MGGFCAKEDVDRLNGFFSAGYAWWSRTGMGGGSLNLVLLNAFRREAKDDFFAKGELPMVATEDWVECVNGAFTFFAGNCIDCAESCDVTESPREWKYDPDLSACGVKMVGDSSPEFELPHRLWPPRPKSGVD